MAKNQKTNNKIDQNKVHNDLGKKKLPKFQLYSQENKFGYLTGEDALLEKRLLKKAARTKRFEYWLLHSDL